MTLARLVRGPHVLPLAMFFGTFSWSFVYVSLPFHIHRISTWDATSTLRWTGWSGEAIGVINAARIGASFLGPVIATSLLAAGSPVLLYVALSLIGLACVPLSTMRAHVPAVPR